jgi:sulfur carrier protein ThiS
MRVRVVPYAELRRLMPGGNESLWLDLPPGSTVGDALRELNIVTEERLIIGLDGTYATPETPLHAGAELTLVTPMMGGATTSFSVQRGRSRLR